MLMFTGLVTPTQALSKTAAYGICQAAIKDQFGKSTLTRLKKIDYFSEQHNSSSYSDTRR